MKIEPVSKSQKEQNLIARKNKYLKYLSDYPLYSTLLVLKDYEEEEKYEECYIIKSALDDYNTFKIKGIINDKIQEEEILLPTHINQYYSKTYQKILNKYGIEVEEEDAKKKAKRIKINIPVK